MRTIFSVSIILLLSTAAFAQDGKPPEPDRSTTLQSPITRSQILQLPRRDRQPKISLQRALKIAEGFIKKAKLNISGCYLFHAKLIFDERGTESHWQFWWVNVNGMSGNDIMIAVQMDGYPKVLSSP